VSRLVAVLTVVTLLFAYETAPACTFCGGELRSRQTLRMHYAAAQAVLHGQLKNPRFDPKTDEGFTDLHVIAALKDHPARGGSGVITLRSYLPVIGNTPPDYLVFCAVANDKLDPTFGVPATAAVLHYLRAAARLDDSDPAAKLGFFYKHLDAADATVAADAFLEFARAADAEIVKAAKHFDPVRLRKLLADPATPPERLGVFAFLLGVCGGADDAAFLARLLHEDPPRERTATAYGGLLAGYVLLDPKDGWPLAARLLGDETRPYSLRLATLETVRFFQANRGRHCRAEVLKCYAALLPHADLADQAIEDLRRWGYWDLTAAVLAQFAKPSHSAPVVRRTIVRYALCCPEEAARTFVAALRRTDPGLVRLAEEQLEALAPKK
jgi:hypothetical protein